MKMRSVIAMAGLAVACASSPTDTSPPPPAPPPAPPPPPPPPPLTHPAGTLDATLPIDGRPHGVTALPDGRFAVSLIDGNAIRYGQVTATGATLLGSTAVGDTPAHVATSPDGDWTFTTNQFGSSVSVVDAAAGAVVAELPLSSGGFNLLVSPDGARLYVTTAGTDLHVFDLATLTEVATVDVGSAANGLALDPVAGRLYVSSVLDGKVTSVATATNQVVRTYQVSGRPQRLALSEDGATLYIASEAVGLEILDLTSESRAAFTAVGSGAVGLALSPDKAVIYLTRPPSGEVVIFDLATRTVTGRLAGLAWPRNVAFTLDGRAALVTGEGGAVYLIR